MKKITICIVLAVLCLNFCGFAQPANKFPGIKIGQPVPDVLLSNVRYAKTPGSRLSDFKGKLVVLDFWATWCSPCIAMLPRLDSLQRQFASGVQFIAVTHEPDSIVFPFLAALRKGKAGIYPEVTNDTILGNLFPHKYLPHYVWIDGDGIVRAITDHDAVNAANIEKMLKTGAAMKIKEDKWIVFDRKRPLFSWPAHLNADKRLNQSFLTSHVQNLGSSSSVTTDSLGGRRITCINLSIARLYSLAFGDKGYFGTNRMLFSPGAAKLLKKPAGMEQIAWYQTNTYCYELIVPPHQSKALSTQMRADLARYFPAIAATVEKKMVKCLLLQRTSAEDKLATAGGKALAQFSKVGCRIVNNTLNTFVRQMNLVPLQHSEMPLVDATGYRGKVDFELNGNISDIASLNGGLAKYGLQIVEGEKELEMLVFSENTAVN